IEAARELLARDDAVNADAVRARLFLDHASPPLELSAMKVVEPGVDLGLPPRRPRPEPDRAGKLAVPHQFPHLRVRHRRLVYNDGLQYQPVAFALAADRRQLRLRRDLRRARASRERRVGFLVLEGHSLVASSPRTEEAKTKKPSSALMRLRTTSRVPYPVGSCVLGPQPRTVINRPESPRPRPRGGPCATMDNWIRHGVLSRPLP